MKGRCVAAMLLMLSLVAGGLLSAAAADDIDSIRLSNDRKGFAADHTVMAATARAGKTKRPWKCCDQPLCTRSLPPTCRCTDKVERCGGERKSCEQVSSDPPRYNCNDQYRGDSGPKCTNDVRGGN